MIEYVAIVIMFCIAGGIAFVIIGMPRPLTRAKDIGRLNKEFRRRTKVMGNRDWGDCLLSNPGLYILTMNCIGRQTLQEKFARTCLSSKNSFVAFFTKNLYKKT